jgi:hypothetical protein
MGIASRHGAIPTPFVVAGGGSTFRLGRVVDADGAGHARLLVSLAQAMGLNNINTYGNLDTGSGPLAGLA